MVKRLDESEARVSSRCAQLLEITELEHGQFQSVECISSAFHYMREGL
jgi:hypothetical protein